MKTYKLFFVLLILFFVAGCGAKMDNTYDDVNQKVNEAQNNITKVSVDDLKTIIDNHGEIKIIDCREKEEYINGHIPGAINIPRGVLEFSSKISNRREPIYVYSQTVDRASLACPTLKLLKYDKVYLVDGGWQEWNETFPELIEEGEGDTGGKPAPKVEESGGCGG
ncbi:MAG: rhodanese-like domain-containing protein [Bacteroidales bacterium]|nr:rhodanese-like domain-containing protein [Bacteroidales bacterium]